MSNVIPTVPKTEINLSSDGLKNLAGWLARYNKLTNENKSFYLFEQNIVGYSLAELLNTRKLVKFEPSISELEGVSKSSDGDYEPYEFDLYHEGDSFFIGPNDTEVFVSVHFYFIANNKVSVYALIQCTSEVNREHRYIRTIFFKNYLNSIGFSNFEINEEDEDMRLIMTWLEADEIINKINSQPQIPDVPA